MRLNQLIEAKITTGKYNGDDKYSWAVFVDGRPAYTGLQKSELSHYKKLAKDIADRKAMNKT